MKRNLALILAAGIVLVAVSVFYYYPREDRRADEEAAGEPGGSTPVLYAGEVLSICEGCQGQFGDLRIGLGFTRKSDSGVTAGLWIYVRDDSSKNKTLDVREGQAFEVAKYSIEVEEIKVGASVVGSGKGGSILLRIKEKLSAEQQKALGIAQKHLQTLERYRYWKERGFEYEVFDIARPLSEDSPEYKPELWTIYFIPYGVSDQGVRITVDVDKGTVVGVELDQG